MRCKDEEIDWAADYVRNMSLFAFFQILKERQTLLGVGVQVLEAFNIRSRRVNVRDGGRSAQYVKRKVEL